MGKIKIKEGWSISIEFKLEDLWIGAFWKSTKSRFDLWICIIPCLPIHYESWIIEDNNNKYRSRRLHEGV